MRIGRYNLKLNKDFDRLKVLHRGHQFFVFFALLMEMKIGVLSIYSGPIWAITLILFYRLFYRTKSNLYYTFWMFSLILFLYILGGIYSGSFITGSAVTTYLYFLAMITLMAEAYILSSPVYYPIVRWWEYDFRYRSDLKVEVNCRDKEVEGRLTDLRRGAGCILSFEEFVVGDSLSVKLSGEESSAILKSEIMSKREYSVGRGIAYGVKFQFDSPGEKKTFDELCKLFSEDQSSRKRMKFKKFESAT